VETCWCIANKLETDLQIFIFPTPSQVKANGGEGGQVLANEAAGPAFTVLAPSPDRRAEVMTQIEELDVRAALQRSTPVAGTHVFKCFLHVTCLQRREK
jgi:hypothetical protein